LITAGLNAVTMITGFAIFAAIRRTLAFAPFWECLF
jgi:hypothetical protein